jgi:HK97 family phage major capsid protein
VGVGADGGYAVAPMFAHDLLDLSLEGEIVRPRAHVYPMDSAILVVPGFDALNHTGASIAGFTGGWVKELSTSTAQKPKMRDITLRLEKCGIYGQVSNELLRFATYMDAELMRLLAQAIGFYLDTGFLTGTGAAGQPLGVLNDPALITVSKEGSQSADTIVASNLLKMFARLHPQCFRNAIWVVNQSTLPQLLSVNIEYTRGTDGLAIRPEPLFREVASGSFVCMGRPVIVTEKTPGLGDKGDIILADFGQYAVGMYRDIFIDKSNAPGWYTDATDYRALVHAGGMGKWNAPLTPANGSTLSWCVTLEAR